MLIGGRLGTCWERGEIPKRNERNSNTLNAPTVRASRSCNPLFMKYTPKNGKFAGQETYGYKSFSIFIDSCASVNAGETTLADYDKGEFPSVNSTMQGTAILEAGRMSLDNDNVR